MASQKQIEANRRNARRSTGPRTAKGKSVSKLNALRNGICAETEVLPDEDPAELAALATEYEEFYHPSSPPERCCVASLVSADWRLRRFRRIEAALWDYGSMDSDGRRRDEGLTYVRCRETLGMLQRRIDSADRSFHRALQQLEKIRRVSATPGPLSAPPQPAEKPELAPEPENSIGFVPSFPVRPAPAPSDAEPTQVLPPELAARRAHAPDFHTRRDDAPAALAPAEFKTGAQSGRSLRRWKA